MIDSAHLKRLLLGTAVLLALSAGATLAAGLPPSFAGGLAVGWLLGAAPFASWTWIVSRALGTSRGRVVTVLLLVTVSVHQCDPCNHYFRAQPPFLRPDAIYTNRVVEKACTSNVGTAV